MKDSTFYIIMAVCGMATFYLLGRIDSTRECIRDLREIQAGLNEIEAKIKGQQ